MEENLAINDVPRGMSKEEKRIIAISSLGTVFEWYDFYLYASLSSYIGVTFFSNYPKTTQDIFALLTFAAGFIVRPLGAIFFGRFGDVLGRKKIFIYTIFIMGISTFLVGILPGSNTIGFYAPVILIILRLFQGLAIGGEYGGATTYVAEHAPKGKRGYFTSWIQMTGACGLLLSLLVIFIVESVLDTESFASWGWRIPFLGSFIFLGISLYIRIYMNESPAFQRIKSQGKLSKAPISEAFGQWKNLKLVLIALFGLTAGQGVVSVSGRVYMLFFIQSVLHLETKTANFIMAISLVLTAFFMIFFGWLSDKVGRKYIICSGYVLVIFTFFPLFHILVKSINPALAKATESINVVIYSDPAECNFQFNPIGTSKFTTPCDVAAAYLTNQSVPFKIIKGIKGEPTTVTVNSTTISSYSQNKDTDNSKISSEIFKKQISMALVGAGYPLKRAGIFVANHELNAFLARNPELNTTPEEVRAHSKTQKRTSTAYKEKNSSSPSTETYYFISNGGEFQVYSDPNHISYFMAILVITTIAIYGAMIYSPSAALLVELFPTKIRYSSISLPYHIGNGWFGGMLPATTLAISTATGNIYSGLWYPILIVIISLIICIIYLPKKDPDELL